MSKVEADFQFEMGALVYIRGSSHTAGLRPVQFVVIERIAQECNGGIQRMYLLAGEAKPYSELALTLEEPPYRPMPEEAMKDRERVAKADRAAYRS